MPCAPPAGDYTRIRPPRCPSPGGGRPCTSRAASYGMAWDISGGGSSFGAAASCICRVAGVIHLSDAGRGWRELTARLGSRAAATDAIHRAARSSATRLFNPGAAGTDKLCSVTRPASRHVSCARLISPSFVCTQQGDHTRMQSPCYPKSARGRPCTVRAASYDMPGDISRGGSSFGTAASCNCRVAG